jgi:hypothetical protein
MPAIEQRIELHRNRCSPYRRILAGIDGSGHPGDGLAGLPWIPARLFKTHDLHSLQPDEVFKIAMSSGTSGARSRIHLDRKAAIEQQRVLSDSIRTILGPERRPMLIADAPMKSVGGTVTARTASIVGLLPHGTNHVFALDDQEQPDIAAIRGFLDRYGRSPYFICGLTTVVWLRLYPVARDLGLDLSDAILLHSGGWKRVLSEGVTNAEFRHRLAMDTGLTRVHSYYGMVEQLGTIFAEGSSDECFYCPDHAQIIIRDPLSWREQSTGVPGVIEVVSVLPTSYPGNVLLTEDLGVVRGVDDGELPGKRFSVIGRVPRAESRGCGNFIGS